MAQAHHLHRAGARLSLSWSLRNGVARARHLGRAAMPPKESFLIKKGGCGRAMQRDELQRFREEFVERILYDGDNYYRHQAIKALNPVTRQHRSSTTLQSPYTQLKS
ncbi:hypothetical protein PIB30_087308, partial [Stylosanthes scabra]|nr:hypothetical protein [Stylosanthes scabra]